jgi:hypothetical protein
MRRMPGRLSEGAQQQQVHTSGARSLTNAGGSCGSVEAWTFWAIWYSIDRLTRWSGIGSPNPASESDGICSGAVPAWPSSGDTSIWTLLHVTPLSSTVMSV